MPTTLLKANPSNFRALVQKYTGRSTGIDVSSGRKGPVTLDFRSPASVLKEVIFPSSGDLQNHDCATYRHSGYGESHVTCEREGTKAASYQMGQLCNDYMVCGGYDDHGHHDNHDEGDLVREYLENSSFNGVNCDDFYHDTVLLEEFMRDLDF
ncbi:uncharacterized protein LOC125584525 [Brassica napus]|uniref:uncharacterized protein LOC125584525 n=1 Tax=Brassica napus TaxID=3708 RepID=UPI00207907CA|nr:uncharacterized protein LOC125584525 [Brassica napus]